VGRKTTFSPKFSKVGIPVPDFFSLKILEFVGEIIGIRGKSRGFGEKNPTFIFIK
jgi:hypothetical protein